MSLLRIRMKKSKAVTSKVSRETTSCLGGRANEYDDQDDLNYKSEKKNKSERHSLPKHIAATLNFTFCRII